MKLRKEHILVIIGNHAMAKKLNSIFKITVTIEFVQLTARLLPTEIVRPPGGWYSHRLNGQQAMEHQPLRPLVPVPKTQCCLLLRGCQLHFDCATVRDEK